MARDPEQSADGTAMSPLVYDEAEIAAADKVAVMIPGALARTGIFAPAQGWTSRGYALVHHRFPGLDGLPLQPPLIIEEAAACIAVLAARHPGKPFRLLGYSTGGPIAISAAEQIGGDVCVAAMSSAVERAGGVATALRTTRDVLSAAARLRSVSRRRVWLEYYKTLLFGRRGREEARAAAILSQQMEQMIYPDSALLAAHTDDLRRWRLADRPRLSAARLTFFVGQDDPVFSGAQTARFARHFGRPGITRYPGHGHLLFLSHPEVFSDVLTFFETADG